MGEYMDLLTGDAPAEPKPEGMSYYELLLGKQPELRSDPAGSRPLKPIGDSLDKAPGFFATLKASLAPDVKDQITHLSQSMGIPEDRFGVMDGHIVYADSEGNYNRVTPSVFGGNGIGDTFLRAGNYVASQFGPSLPTTVGGVAGVASTPLGGPASIGIAAGASGATDIARQAVSNALIDKPLGDIDLANAGGQALMGGLGQGGGALFNRLMTRNPLGLSAFDRSEALDPVTRRKTADLLAEAKSRGIDLSGGQATGLRSLLARERQLGRYDETADQVYDFAKNQRDVQVPNAVRREIESISPMRGESAINSFRRGADQVMQLSLNVRNAEAQKAYGAALDNKPPFINDDLRELFSRPSVKNGLAKAKTIAAEKGYQFPKFVDFDASGAPKFTNEEIPDWRSWDFIKQGIDDVIEENTNEFGKLNAFGKAAADTKKKLLSILDEVNPAYKEARRLYGTSSDAMEAITDGGVGFINKMDGMDRQNIVNRVFSAQNITPEGVARARAQFKMAGQMADWDAGVASFLSDKLDNAMKVNASGTRGNVPGKFYAQIWGDERQRDIMVAALGKDRVQGFERFMGVLNAASRGLPEGSPTATDLAAMGGPQTVSRGLQVAGKIASPGTYLNIGDELVRGLDALRAPGARIKLANALLSGDYDKQLARLRMLPPTGQKALTAVNHILVSAGLGATGARTPADRPIPAMQKQDQQ